MHKTILFDFDGTIADSLEAILNIYNETVTPTNGKLIRQEDLQKYRGMHAKDIISDLGIPLWKLPSLIISILFKFTKEIPSLPLIPNIKPCLEQLHSQSVPLHILSSNSEKNIELFLKQHEINFFDSIVSCGTDLFGKGRVIKNFLKKLQLKPEQVIYVGDEVRDIEAAKANNVSIIAVSWGYNTRHKLTELHPDYLVDTPEQLLQVLNEVQLQPS